MTFAAHITYKLEAFVKPDKITGPKLQCEKKLAIREPAKEEVKGHSAEVIVPKTSWYNNMKGVYTLKVHFEKTSYRPGEIARVAMELTTTGPYIHLAEVSFILNQRLRLGTTCNWVLYTIPKAAQVLRGIRTQGPVYANSFSIRIPIFKGDDHDLDKRKKCWPRGTSDDSYGSLSLVTQNKLISSKLLLEVNCTLYGCKKASPKISCPLEVVYPELWEEEVHLPEDWNAQKYPCVDVVFEEGKKVEKKEKKAKKVIKINGEEIEMKKRAMSMSHSVVQIFPEGGRQIGV